MGGDWSALPPPTVLSLPGGGKRAGFLSLSCCCLLFPSMPRLISSLHLKAAESCLCYTHSFMGCLEVLCAWGTFC